MDDDDVKKVCRVERKVILTDVEEICDACEKYRIKREQRMAEEAKLWFFEITYFLVIFGSLFFLTLCSR
jgi:hypothetical protein